MIIIYFLYFQEGSIDFFIEFIISWSVVSPCVTNEIQTKEILMVETQPGA